MPNQYVEKAIETDCVRELSYSNLPPHSWQREVYGRGWRFYELGSAITASAAKAAETNLEATEQPEEQQIVEKVGEAAIAQVLEFPARQAA